ncbi:MAG TPA: TraB/GumN family protein [Vibrio sp.]|nr:TraB/GumN family protein [Vibrio sp.]
MKRIYCLVLILTSSFAMAEPLYWQASKGKLNYLITGSVHVGDDSMYPLPTNLTTFLQHSNGIVVETDIRNTSGVQYPSTTVTTQQVLSDARQKELIGISKLLGINDQQLLLAPPWASALTIQMKLVEYLGYKAQDGVDLWLLSQASAQGKQVYSLETMQFQINLLARLPNGGEELLTSAIDDFDHMEDAAHCLIKSWKHGDINKLNEFARLSEMSPELEDAFLFQRNRDWAKQLANGTLFPNHEGNYLIVVGALHLLGRNSVLELLQAQGFTVTQRSKSTTANCEFKY